MWTAPVLQGVDLATELTGDGHLDEMFVKINGERHYLWRAVDHEGEVLEPTPADVAYVQVATRPGNWVAPRRRVRASRKGTASVPRP